MTRAEIRFAVIQALREGVTPVRWTIDELNEYLDDGYRDMAERTAAVVRTFTVTAQNGQNYITYPTVSDSAGTLRVLHPLAVKDVSTDLPLDPVHWTFVDNTDRTWASTTGQRPYFYAFWDYRTLFIYPSFGTTGTLNVIASVIPDGFPSDDFTPEVPEDYHDALIHYGLWRATMKGAQGARFGRAARQLGLYSERLVGLGQWTNERHEGIFRAMYGQNLRVPADMWGNQ